MKYSNTILMLLILVSIVVLLFLNLVLGSVSIPFHSVWNIICGNGDEPVTWQNIIWKSRFPQALTALVAGAGLAISGLQMQTVFRNPLAGPSVLGISSGASMGVAFVVLLSGSLGGVALSKLGFMGEIALSIAAIVGSLSVMALIVYVSQKVKGNVTLLIIGVMIGYICSAVTDFLVTFAEDSDIVNLHNWSMGSFSGITWENVKTIVFVVAVTGILTFFLSKPMEAYQLGETYAKNMGVNIKMFRVLLVILSSILSAVVTAFAGPVSFVGIAVPQMVKRLFRTAKPIIMIPACFIGGAVFCMFCDLLARMVFAPTEMSISTVTAIFGAPVMIAVMLKQRQERY